MDRQKIENALEELKWCGYITAHYTSYKFTDAGRNYTRKTSGNTWNHITEYTGSYGSYLWARREPRYKDSWTFIPFSQVTEEQFADFCKYYNINTEEPTKLVICNEVEFMDI